MLVFRTDSNISISIIGRQGNAWDNENTGLDGFSEIVDLNHCPHFSIFGEISAESDLEFWVSQDGENFYFCKDITNKLPGGQEGQTKFHIYETMGARYCRLRSSDDVVATVTIAGKP